MTSERDSNSVVALVNSWRPWQPTQGQASQCRSISRGGARKAPSLAEEFCQKKAASVGKAGFLEGMELAGRPRSSRWNSPMSKYSTGLGRLQRTWIHEGDTLGAGSRMS